MRLWRMIYDRARTYLFDDGFRPRADIRLQNLNGSSPTESRHFCRPVECILTHIGEPSEAPPISPCRGSPAWEMLDQTVELDRIHPEPEYELDQSASW